MKKLKVALLVAVLALGVGFTAVPTSKAPTGDNVASNSSTSTGGGIVYGPPIGG